MNIFLDALEDSKKELFADKELLADIELITLLGSVADGDAVEVYSDLDILIMIKTNNFGTYSLDTVNKLRLIVEKLSAQHNVRISFMTFTRFDLDNWVDAEFLTHFSWGRTIYANGPDLRQISEEILKKRNIKQDPQKEMRSIVISGMNHLRFDLSKKYIYKNKHNTTNYIRDFGRDFIDKMFEVCDWYLIYENIWSKNKREITENICRFLDQDDSQVIKKAYDIRENWNFISDDELEGYFSVGIKCLLSIIESVLEKEAKNGTKS
jgi:predicted nucleotidyltransferase